jgi:hypothetical protein
MCLLTVQQSRFQQLAVSFSAAVPAAAERATAALRERTKTAAGEKASLELLCWQREEIAVLFITVKSE